MEVFFQPVITNRGIQIQEYTTTGESLIDETNGRIVIPEGKSMLMTIETGNGKLFAYNIAWIEESV